MTNAEGERIELCDQCDRWMVLATEHTSKPGDSAEAEAEWKGVGTTDCVLAYFS